MQAECMDSHVRKMDRIFRRYYSDQKYNGTLQFWRFIDNYIAGSCRILEIGAGPTNATTEYLSGKGSVTGIDIDEAVKGNKHCIETVTYDGVHMPFADGSFDLAVSSYVFEHVEKPDELMVEIRRVLRPGGVLVFRTPNLWHYVSIGARIVPKYMQKKVINYLQNGQRKEQDIYPTYHRMNTSFQCRKLLLNAGFQNIEIKLQEYHPSYFGGSQFLFYLMMLWERIINSTELLKYFRANILVKAEVCDTQDENLEV